MPKLCSAAGIAVLTLSAAAQWGCASSTGPRAYPSAWPPLDKTRLVDGCPDISGSYRNRAVDGSPAASGLPTLTDVFQRMAHGPGLFRPPDPNHAWPVPANAESATFRLAAEQLGVTFTAADQSATSLAFRRYRFSWNEKRYDDLFTCYSGEDGPRLRFFAEPESHSGGIPYLYVEAGGTLVFLLRAVDGSLIVQWRSDSLGISALVVGTRMKFDSVWWRFAPEAGPR
jgi:hypothetical protein